MREYEQLINSKEFNVGDIVYINVPEGDAGIVYALVLYSTHVEYLVRTKEGTIQLDSTSLSEDKVFV